MRNIVSIILAAGKGDRLNNKNMPKVMFMIGNRPMIDYCVKIIEDLRIKRIIVVVGFKKKMVMNYLNGRVEFVEQKKRLGTGHAVLQAKNVLEGFNGYVLISYGDVPFLTRRMFVNLLSKCKRKRLSGCILTVKIKKNPPEWGRIVRNKRGDVIRIVEEKDAVAEEKKISELNTGIYCFRAKDLFKYLKRVNKKNIQGEYYLTDVVEIMSMAGLKIDTVITSDIKHVIGINKPEELAEARKMIK